MNTLPTITPDLPGIGGKLKAEPSHFVVEEIPVYEACGEGPHLFVSLTREGWTTRRVAEALAGLYDLPVQAIGYAGMKDRHARCTQAFSLPGLTPEDSRRIEPALSFQVHWARQHTNKLKVGHLLGNRFRITVVDLAVAPEEALARAQAIATAIAQRGLPNFFGPQRFGFDGANVEKGRKALLGQGPRGDKWFNRLMISAYQSHLFNRYLARRMELGLFEQLLVGDVCKKADTGGMFDVQDAAVEQLRYERGEITFTGPIFGKKMWAAKDAAAELEAHVLAEAELTDDDLRKVHADGTRRPARLWLQTIGLFLSDDGLQVDFALPKGAYATVVLREFMKSDEGTDQFADVSDE